LAVRSAILATAWLLVMSKFHRLALFGGFAFHKVFDFQCLLNLR